jgi:hypothetical protein
MKTECRILAVKLGGIYSNYYVVKGKNEAKLVTVHWTLGRRGGMLIQIACLGCEHEAW